MEKILVNSHVYLLGYEMSRFDGEFDPKDVEAFLSEKCSETLVEYAAQTLLHTIPEVASVPVTVKVKKAFQNQAFWFVVFELNRPIYRKYKGNLDSTFVYCEGDHKIISVAEDNQQGTTTLEGEEIYSCEE